MATQTRRILVNRMGQEPLIVEGIPATAKITFAKANPAEKGYGNNPMALRIYTSANNQLAVFLNVTDFRDLSLKVQERVTKSELNEEAERGPDGEYKKSDYHKTVEWKEVEF
jgi:hypothetical protein